MTAWHITIILSVMSSLCLLLAWWQPVVQLPVAFYCIGLWTGAVIGMRRTGG